MPDGTKPATELEGRARAVSATDWQPLPGVVKSDRIAAHRRSPCSQHQPSGAAQRVSARQTIAWPYAGGIVGYHLLALLALVPWFFTWSGVVLSFAGLFVFGTLGINLGYHRLLTHRGLICPKWLERTFVVLGVC